MDQPLLSLTCKRNVVTKLIGSTISPGRAPRTMKQPNYTFLLFSGLIAPSITMAAPGQPTADIVVTSSIMERTLYETPAAMSVVRREPIQEGQPRLKLNETLSQVPGIFLQNSENFAQGERIAIRGFGASFAG